MSENELRPCPFCGEPADDRYNRLAKCSNKQCLMNYWIEDDADFYIRDDWNTRPIEDDLRKRIAELEEAQRWIPVSDRLPEDGVAVLVAFTENPKDIDILTAKYYKHYAGFGGLDNWWNIEGWHTGNVTHWMPLPEPPEVTE